MSDQINTSIDKLRVSRKDHVDLVHKTMEADERAVYGVDLVVIAVAHRSIALIDGFTAMVESRNALCANALLRLQVDNIIRLFACWLVDNPDAVAFQLQTGKPLNQLKSKDGKSLTDRYLVSQACKLYPWISGIYKQTSGFIHLSQSHMIAPVVEITERGTLMRIGSNVGREWKDNEILEAISAFTEATRSVLHLCNSWLVVKDTASKRRAGLPVSYPTDTIIL